MKDRKKHVTELEQTAEILRIKVEEARKQLKNEPLTMEYNNGGGQSGVRENPAFPAFEKLLKSYQAVITQLESLAKEEQTEKVVTLVNSKWKRA